MKLVEPAMGRTRGICETIRCRYLRAGKPGNHAELLTGFFEVDPDHSLLQPRLTIPLRINQESRIPDYKMQSAV